MNITLTVPNADLDALSAQLESRWPRSTDADGNYDETAADHVTRALQAFADAERSAGTLRAAAQAVRDAPDDAARSAALLAEYKLRKQQAARGVAAPDFN